MFTLIAHVGTGGTTNGVTSGAIDTSSANLIVVSVSYYAGLDVGTLSDSKVNTWNALSAQQTGANIRQRLFWTSPSSVGAGHTFSFNGTTIFPSIQVAAFNGAHATPFDAENGAVVGGVSTIQTGNITPSENNCLVITGLTHEDNSFGAVSIGSGFTITDSNFYSGGNHEGGSMAYLIQTTAAAANPQWNITNPANDLAAAIASFKVSTGGSAVVLMGQAVL